MLKPELYNKLFEEVVCKSPHDAYHCYPVQARNVAKLECLPGMRGALGPVPDITYS